jgi:serine protease Do
VNGTRRTRLVAVVIVAAVLAGCTSARPSAQRSPSPAPATSSPLSPLPPADTSGDPVVRVVQRVRPAVVNVRADVGGQPAEGTGFVVDGDGVVVTNFHVVEGALAIRVITSDGRRFDARAIGGDSNADLAVLKIQASDLPTVPLGDSDSLRLGETVVALGFALDLEGGPSVTSGIVSGLGRTIEAGGPGTETRTYEDLIQTDAAINPGNSGGPLVDLRGRVVGINTAGVQAGAAENIGFAIAIDRARPFIEHAIANPAGPSPLLGVSTRTVDALVAAQFGLSVDHGALVVEVLPDGPAGDAGIETGDVIVSLAGEDVGDNDELQERLLEHRPGEEVQVGLVQGDQEETVEVTLGVRPLPIQS